MFETILEYFDVISTAVMFILTNSKLCLMKGFLKQACPPLIEFDGQISNSGG